jgi:hypothetical protein
MSIVKALERSQAPLGAACVAQTGAPNLMPLLAELGSRVGVLGCYRHVAPKGAFAPVPGASLRVGR